MCNIEFKLTDFQKLLQGAEKLRGLLDGLSIRISHVNQVSGESNQIDVAWNFEV